MWWHLLQQTALILDKIAPAEGQIDMLDTLIPSDKRIFMNDRTTEFSRSLFSLLLTTIGQNMEVIENKDSLEEKNESECFLLHISCICFCSRR